MKYIFLVAMCCLLSSCTTATFSDREVEINIESLPTTNNSRLTYFMLRNVSRHTFALEPYEHVSTKVFNSKDNDSIVYQDMILPGEERSFIVDDNRKGMGLYFFFTEPSKMWKAYLTYDRKNDAYYIELGDRGIESVEKEHWIFRIF